MARYRDRLPQLGGELFLTDGGIETTLIFLEGLDLPHFAAFDLLRDEDGTAVLERYFRGYAEIARTHGTGLVLESATWRASPDWGEKLGYTPAGLADANRRSIDLLTRLREELERQTNAAIVISGCVGPRGDGYDPGAVMTPEEAEGYHARQAEAFAETEADQITAITMTNTNEAIGVTRAALAAGLPPVISFTVETDGRLPTGQPLNEAIDEVDSATRDGPAYYMINCAHPTHFADVLDVAAWARRIRGLRANASRRSHAELDAATDLDDGNPKEFGAEHAAIRERLPWINVLGGCCGTDNRHITEVARACAAR